MTRGTSRLILLAVLAASPVLAQVTDTPQRSREKTPNMPPPHETLPERVRPGDTDATGTVRPSAPTPDPKASDGVLRPQKG
ncbi:hypothetical protein [Methylobacterium frigidaeris]|uniref:Uncharacterized protein n=1 Tax=Methylobacterium frigidaeris TaxID=2038277 RepID=A0AA37HAX1_9HYPH|nr:hypothetical protein [Methylobacterium frigidaeris]PIK68522.1 hypothetical protein CS379_34535 [Methylobacterium frigidaeris]GJD61890.1 hypothetical protein MPEAHAMD_2039 [Methylobacterium frigidaeris]